MNQGGKYRHVWIQERRNYFQRYIPVGPDWPLLSLVTGRIFFSFSFLNYEGDKTCFHGVFLSITLRHLPATLWESTECFSLSLSFSPTRVLLVVTVPFPDTNSSMLMASDLVLTLYIYRPQTYKCHRAHGGQRTACGNPFSPFTRGVSGIKLGSSQLAADICTCWVTSSVHNCFLFRFLKLGLSIMYLWLALNSQRSTLPRPPECWN